MTTEAPWLEGAIGLTEEGEGLVATCKRCWWLVWTETRKDTVDTAKEHKCRKVDLKPIGQRYPRKPGKGER